MTTAATQPSSASGIISDALRIEPCSASAATHYVICKGAQLRYIIAKGGEAALARTVVSYGGKAAALLKHLSHLPKRVLTWAHLGFWAKIEAQADITSLIPQGYRWNVLVGTYCDKQKLVFQCFEKPTDECLFVKVGNAASEREMQAEMTFLQQDHPSFIKGKLPQLLGAHFRSERSPFNIMMTREFRGEKVEITLTQAVVDAWKEIAAVKQTDGEAGHLEFSHGDFAPWNLRCQGEHYIVFDWEHCGMKPHGYDLLYWGVVTRLARCGMHFDEAYEAAVTELQHYDVHPTMNKEEFYRLFTEVITPDGF